MHIYNLLLPLQQIRQVFPRDEPAIDTPKSARQNGGYSNQRQGSPRRLAETNTSQDWRIADESSPDQVTLIDQWACGVCGVKPWRWTARTAFANDDRGRLYGTDGLCVCATTKTRKLLTNNGNRPIEKTCNKMVWTKPRAVHNMHRRENSTKKQTSTTA